jgi:hypothetical protein
MADANPFVYGEIVTRGAFADRDAERERLAGDLLAGQKVFLISPRRYGKSSLVTDVLAGLARQRVLTIEVTVAASSSYVAFLEAYARALVTADTPTGRLKRWTQELLQVVRPEVRFDASTSGTPRFTLAFPATRTSRDVARLAAEVFALPARIAAARRQRLAIALDEFQAIEGFDDNKVEEALRSAVQTQRDVGYVFAGSEPSLMDRPRHLQPFHRSAVSGQRYPGRTRARRRHRRSGGQRALRRAAARARSLGRRADAAGPIDRSRRSAHDADAAAR